MSEVVACVFIAAVLGAPNCSQHHVRIVLKNMLQFESAAQGDALIACVVGSTMGPHSVPDPVSVVVAGAHATGDGCEDVVYLASSLLEPVFKRCIG